MKTVLYIYTKGFGCACTGLSQKTWQMAAATGPLVIAEVTTTVSYRRVQTHPGLVHSSMVGQALSQNIATENVNVHSFFASPNLLG